jgi:beta-lactam-binding protein with PASTA domain
VPKLKGKSAKAAKKALSKADCKAKISKKRVGKRKQVGKVVSSKKKTGFTAPPGTKIPITVGKG